MTTWFPERERATAVGCYTSGQFVGLAFLSALLYALAKGWSLGLARKLPIITGLLISSSIIGANYVQSPALVILFMSLACFGTGLASITWSLVSATTFIAATALTGAICHGLVVGKVERIVA